MEPERVEAIMDWVGDDEHRAMLVGAVVALSECETIVRLLATTPDPQPGRDSWNGCPLCGAVAFPESGAVGEAPKEGPRHTDSCPWRLAVEWANPE